MRQGQWCPQRLSLALGPAHLAATHDVDVEDRYTAVRPLVQHQTVSFGQPQLISTLLGHDHHVTQQLK